MFRFYRWLHVLTGFTQSQINGFLVLLPLMILVLFSEPIYRNFVNSGHSHEHDDIQKLDSLITLWNEKDDKSAEFQPSSQTRPSPVDPNTATKTELQSIGLPSWLAGRIISYRESGGSFKIKTDLMKIYGMDSLMYLTITPFISLRTDVTKQPKNEVELVSSKNIKHEVSFDLNLADTAQLKKIYGIGEKLSLRIIKYREALGGFTSLNQLHEIYRLDTAVIQKIKTVSFISQGFTPNRININTAGRPELTSHPYLSPQQAEAIVAYRFQHGNFTSVSDLVKIKMMDSLSINKLEAYLKTKD